MVNLLSNAIKFSNQAGDVRIELRGCNANALEVEVTDFGIGFESAEIRNLYKPFYMVER